MVRRDSHNQSTEGSHIEVLSLPDEVIAMLHEDDAPPNVGMTIAEMREKDSCKYALGWYYKRTMKLMIEGKIVRGYAMRTMPNGLTRKTPVYMPVKGNVK